MKTLAMVALVTGLAMRLLAEPLLTDITTYEAVVIDEASSQLLATGGPWVWEDLASQSMSGMMAGTGRIIAVKCRNAAGQTIFGGMITHADLTVPFSPFFPPDPSGQVSLDFFSENYTLAVFLNGTYYVGEMLLLPAEDDPDVPPVKTVDVDIKPGSVKNPFNVKSEGILPVAISGSVDLQVSKIVSSSVKLAGIVPVRYAIADIQGDGYPDLVFHFRDQDIASVLAGKANGEVVPLELAGKLLDDTAIKGADSVTVIRKK
jgi:hypothetical protein